MPDGYLTNYDVDSLSALVGDEFYTTLLFCKGVQAEFEVPPV